MSILSNLEQYINSISALPVDLRKNMASIRSYDVKQQALHSKLLAEQAVFVAQAKQKAEAGEPIDDERLQTLKEQYRTVLALCDKKVNLASQAYEMLDEAIKKLDADLRKFEVELEQKELNLTAAERRKRKASSGVTAAEQRKMFAAAGADGRKRLQGVGGVARTFDVVADMAIDPNEPTYCICQRVSFGEMVGCDNPECKREWFHFECVGLSANPRGKWLCPECSTLRRLNK